MNLRELGPVVGQDDQPSTDLNATLRQAVFASYQEREAGRKPRLHLGWSQLGDECERKLWYSFRLIAKSSFEGRLLRLFQTGWHEEPRIISDLKAIGLEVKEVDDETGEQFLTSHWGGHFGGSGDGRALNPGVFNNLPEHVWFGLEFKTANAKSFARMVKHGVKEAKPEHYDQITGYNGDFDLPGTLYVVKNKDDDDLYFEWVEPDPALHSQLLVKAKRVVFADSPGQRIGGPDYFKCKWCEWHSLCHDGWTQNALTSCRSCIHSTPMEQGGWTCERYHVAINEDQQIAGCDDHRLIPTILPHEFTVKGEREIEWSTPYGVISTETYSTLDILSTHPHILCDDVVSTAKDIFGGEIKTEPKAWEV